MTKKIESGETESPYLRGQGAAANTRKFPSDNQRMAGAGNHPVSQTGAESLPVPADVDRADPLRSKGGLIWPPPPRDQRAPDGILDASKPALDHLRDTRQSTPQLEADVQRVFGFIFADVKSAVRELSKEAQNARTQTH